MKIIVKDRNLKNNEISVLTEYEKKVIWCFKKTTGLNFMRSDLIYLKLMLKRGTSEQICSVIYKAQKDNVQKVGEGLENKFTDFKYLYGWVMRLNLRKVIKK